MSDKLSLREKLNALNNMSVRDYMLNHSHLGVQTFASCILVLLCVFPVLYNMFYNIYDAVKFPGAMVSSSQILGYDDTWMYILFFLNFFMILLAMYQFLSLYYRRGLKEIFSFAWIKDRWLPVCLVLLLFWSFVSALVAPNKMLGFIGDMYRRDGFVTFMVFGFIFLTSFLPNDKQIKTICECLVLSGVAMGFMVALGAKNATYLFFKTNNIKNAVFANSNHFGYFLSVCFPLVVGLTIKDRSKSIWLKIFRVAELWLITNAVMVSSCRGSFIAVIVAMLGWNVYVFWLHRSKWRCMVVLDVLFILFVVLVNTDNEIFRRFASILPDINNAIESGSDKDIAKIGSNRILLWKMGLEDSFEKPIFGYGPDHLGYYLPTSYTDKPHNELIEIAASLGYPALIFYLAGIVGHAVLFFKNIKRVSLLEVITFSSVACYFVSSLFGNVMFYTAPYYYLMLGFSYILLRRDPNIVPLFCKRKKKENEASVDVNTDDTLLADNVVNDGVCDDVLLADDTTENVINDGEHPPDEVADDTAKSTI